MATSITSGVLVDKHSFEWKIQNFDMIPRSPGLVAAQKFQFSAGESIGLPTVWSCFLYRRSDNKSIGIFFKLLKTPSGTKEVHVSFQATVKETNGNYFFFDYEPLKNLAHKSVAGGYGFGQLVPATSTKQVPLLADGSLVIGVEFTLYAPKQEPEVSLDLSGKLETFRIKSLETLSKDLREMDTLASPSSNLVTKIFSKDGMEFPANRGILAARSPVFQRMFDTKMKEAETGEVRIDDLSGKTLKVLLGYIYTGTLHSDWKSDEVVQELAYAARKYDIALLTEFLEGELLEEKEVVGHRECNADGNAKTGLNFWQRIWKRARKEK